MPSVTRVALTQQTAAGARLMADWALIVGPTLAASTRPRKLAGFTLTIACAGPVALEIQHMADVLIGRVNTHIGHALVQRLRLVADTVTPTVTRLAAPRQVRPETLASVARSVAAVPPGPLREALTRLGVAMAAGAGVR